MENSIKQLLTTVLTTNGYIAVNKTLIKKIGLDEAVILGELLTEYTYWQENNLLENDMFYSTQENLEENTGLNVYFQRKALQKLKEFNIIDIAKIGMPARNFFKINFEQLFNVLTTSRATSAQQVVQPVHLNNNKNTNNKPTNSNILFNNNIKTVKKNLYQKGVDLILNFTTDEKLQNVLIEWFELQLEMYRDSNKSFYLNTLKNRLNKLKTDFDESEWFEIVSYALERQWKAFYPLPTKQNKSVNIISQPYTKNELDTLKRLEREREKNGIQTKF